MTLSGVRTCIPQTGEPDQNFKAVLIVVPDGPGSIRILPARTSVNATQTGALRPGHKPAAPAIPRSAIPMETTPPPARLP